MPDLDWKSLPSLSSLRAFDAAARHKSFSAAARALNVTHAAIAMQVRNLESDIGATLMERSPRGIALTEAGQRLAEATSSGFGRIASAIEAEKHPKAQGLRVTTTTFITDAVILPRITEFWQRHPDIEIAFAPTVRVVDIDSEGFDIAIRATDDPVSDPNTVPLMVCPIIAVAAPKLVARVDDWSKATWLGHSASWEQKVMDDAGLSGIKTRDAGDPALELQAAISGIGPAFGSEIVFHRAITDGSLVRIPFETRFVTHYHARLRAGPKSAALTTFLDWLVETFKEAEKNLTSSRKGRPLSR